MILLLIAAQAAEPAVTKATSAPAATSWSVLAPTEAGRCNRQGEGKPDDIVVCAPSAPLPYPELASDPPRPVNRNLDGQGALDALATPCAARSGGCQVGVDIFGAGTALVRLVQKAVAPSSCCEEPGEGTNIAVLAKDVVGGVGKAFRKKPDTSNRVSIPLDDAPPKSVILP